MESQPMFQVGDHVLYPEYGTGRVVDIDDMVRFEEPMAFYLIKMDNNEMKYMVPVGGEKSVGLQFANNRANKVSGHHMAHHPPHAGLHSKAHKKSRPAETAL